MSAARRVPFAAIGTSRHRARIRASLAAKELVDVSEDNCIGVEVNESLRFEACKRETRPQRWRKAGKRKNADVQRTEDVQLGEGVIVSRDA